MNQELQCGIMSYKSGELMKRLFDVILTRKIYSFWFIGISFFTLKN